MSTRCRFVYPTPVRVAYHNVTVHTATTYRLVKSDNFGITNLPLKLKRFRYEHLQELSPRD